MNSYPRAEYYTLSTKEYYAVYEKELGKKEFDAEDHLAMGQIMKSQIEDL